MVKTESAALAVAKYGCVPRVGGNQEALALPSAAAEGSLHTSETPETGKKLRRQTLTPVNSTGRAERNCLSLPPGLPESSAAASIAPRPRRTRRVHSSSSL